MLDMLMPLGLWALLGLFMLVSVAFVISRFKKCESDKILVISGMGIKEGFRCLNGGAKFVVPVVQQAKYMSCAPTRFTVDLKDTLTSKGVKISTSATFLVAIGTEPKDMMTASRRLLDMKKDEIKEMSEGICLGEARGVVNRMDIEEIRGNKQQLVKYIEEAVGGELRKVGMLLLSVNLAEIKDDHGYLEALGREEVERVKTTAAKAIADQDRQRKEAEAEAQRDARKAVADANAKAKESEAEAKGLEVVAASTLRKTEAMQEQQASIAESEAHAKSEIAKQEAERQAQNARAEAEEARLTVDLIIPAKRAMEKVVIEADAEKAKVILAAEAEAASMYVVLEKTAQGLKLIVDVAGGDIGKAISLIQANAITENLLPIIEKQAQALQNLGFDKVTVVDAGGGNGDGQSALTRPLMELLGLSVGAQIFQENGFSMPTLLGPGKKNGTGLSDTHLAPPTSLEAPKGNGKGADIKPTGVNTPA